MGRLASCILLSILVTSTLVALDIHPVKSQNGNWWNTAWSHRRQISITERSGYPLGDFPIEVIFPHNGDVQANGTDIRVIDDSNEIPSYVEECNSTHAKVIFQTSLIPFESKVFYIYYANPSISPPSYPLVLLSILEGNTGHATIDEKVYLGWDYTSWGWSNPVELWNDFRIDFNGNNDPTDDSDLIRDYGGRQGGIGRHRADLPAIGLGDYQNYAQTPIYVDICFADAKLRVYKNHPWVETTQADSMHSFTPSYDFGSCGIGTELNLVDGENLTYPDPGWFSTLVCNSKENPGWMAFRDSSSGYVFASAGFGIGSNYSHHQGGKEASDWDRAINYNNRTRWEPVEPYDQPPKCKIYWYGDNSNGYTKTLETATSLNNQPAANIVPDIITVPDDFPTIQEAINNANDGDTVFVRNGTYSGPLVINKSLTLEGENKDSTIIDGGTNEPSGSIVLVAADNVKISGFTIQHCRSGGNAIWLDSYVNLTFSYNIITGNNEGIRILRSSGNIVSHNFIQDCYYNTAIGLTWAYGNIIYSNIIKNCNVGIGGTHWNNTFFENIIEGCKGGWAGWGISDNFSDCIFFHNNIIDNGDQVYNMNPSLSIWDNGYEGNYWSDYNGTDSDGDGVGDAPYIIDVFNQDNCPLMSPYMPGDINHDAIVDIFDIASIAGIFGCSSADPKYNPHCDVNEDGLIDIFDLVTVAVNFGKEWTPP